VQRDLAAAPAPGAASPPSSRSGADTGGGGGGGSELPDNRTVNAALLLLRRACGRQAVFHPPTIATELAPAPDRSKLQEQWRKAVSEACSVLEDLGLVAVFTTKPLHCYRWVWERDTAGGGTGGAEGGGGETADAPTPAAATPAPAAVTPARQLQSSASSTADASRGRRGASSASSRGRHRRRACSSASDGDAIGSEVPRRPRRSTSSRGSVGVPAAASAAAVVASAARSAAVATPFPTVGGGGAAVVGGSRSTAFQGLANAQRVTRAGRSAQSPSTGLATMSLNEHATTSLDEPADSDAPTGELLHGVGPDSPLPSSPGRDSQYQPLHDSNTLEAWEATQVPNGAGAMPAAFPVRGLEGGGGYGGGGGGSMGPYDPFGARECPWRPEDGLLSPATRNGGSDNGDDGDSEDGDDDDSSSVAHSLAGGVLGGRRSVSSSWRPDLPPMRIGLIRATSAPTTTGRGFIGNRRFPSLPDDGEDDECHGLISGARRPRPLPATAPGTESSDVERDVMSPSKRPCSAVGFREGATTPRVGITTFPPNSAQRLSASRPPVTGAATSTAAPSVAAVPVSQPSLAAVVPPPRHEFVVTTDPTPAPAFASAMEQAADEFDALTQPAVIASGPDSTGVNDENAAPAAAFKFNDPAPVAEAAYAVVATLQLLGAEADGDPAPLAVAQPHMDAVARRPSGV